MATEYVVVLSSPNGVALHRIDDYVSLTYQRVINEPGMLEMVLHENHPAVDDLERDCEVEVFRRDEANGIDWYSDFIGLMVENNYETDERGITYVRLICPGILSLLGRAIIAYPAGTIGRSLYRFSSSLTNTDIAGIAFQTVSANCSAYNTAGYATIPPTFRYYTQALNSANFGESSTPAVDRLVENYGPWRERILEPLALDSANYGIYEGSNPFFEIECSYRNVLAFLQENCSRWNHYMYMYKQPTPYYSGYTGVNGATNCGIYTFSQTKDKRNDATDRTSSVIFAPELDNVTMPRLTRNTLNAPTFVIAGGSGFESSRLIGTASVVGYGTPLAQNKYAEAFIPVNNADSQKGVDDAAEIWGAFSAPLETVDFRVRQTGKCMYGKHYFFGDLVTARIYGTEREQMVVKVTVSVAGEPGNRRDEIAVETRDTYEPA